VGRPRACVIAGRCVGWPSMPTASAILLTLIGIPAVLASPHRPPRRHGVEEDLLELLKHARQPRTCIGRGSAVWSAVAAGDCASRWRGCWG
jgi:hypothetical protein